MVDDAPYVCPGCYAVGGERCAPGCIDDEMDREREEALMSGDYDRIDDDDECECPVEGHQPGCWRDRLSLQMPSEEPKGETDA